MPRSCAAIAALAAAGFIVFVLSAARADSRAARTPSSKKPALDRIAIRHGHFEDSKTHQLFVPLGLNYYRVGKVNGKEEHAALLPGFYDAPLLETMMSDAQAWGFNTVRIFQSYDVGPSGVVTSAEAQELNPAYLANVIDFLRTAQAHRVHVIFTSDWTPGSHWLAAQTLPTEDQYHLTQKWDDAMGVNDLHLYAGAVRTRANVIVQMIAAIRRADPLLLNVVLAWELENESSFSVTNPPLNQTSGLFTLGGKSYDLRSDPQKQELMDAMAVQWADVCADAIHHADPQALVSDSAFSFYAVHRTGPGTMSSDHTPDTRVPVRLLALVKSHLDFLDLHTYAAAGNGTTVASNTDGDLKSDEWDTLKPALRRSGKPILAGESGLFRHDLRPGQRNRIDAQQGLTMLKEHTQRLKSAGFAGTLYWSYGSADSTPADENPPMRFYPEFANAFTSVY